ncbi:unnamed protein product, partial [Arabidopsis halleri]
MVVPFESGDEVVVSLEYEKLASFCQNCSKLTHDMSVCPDFQKKTGSRMYEEHGDRRNGTRQQAKQLPQGQDGGWEKPRKPAAKRALEFSGEENGGGFHYQMEKGENSKPQRRFEKNQAPIWGQKKNFPGTWAASSDFIGKGGATEGFKDAQFPAQGLAYGRKGAGPAWPKPLYQPKSASKLAQIVQQPVQDPLMASQDEEQNDIGIEDVPVLGEEDFKGGMIFSESADDLLEDGECQFDEEIDVHETAEENMEVDGQMIPVESTNAPKGKPQISKVLPIDIGSVSQGMKGIKLDYPKNQKIKKSSSQGTKGTSG